MRDRNKRQPCILYQLCYYRHCIACFTYIILFYVKFTKKEKTTTNKYILLYLLPMKYELSFINFLVFTSPTTF